MQPVPLRPLITPPAPQPRQNKRALLIASGVAVVGAVLGIVLTMGGPKPELRRERPERPIPEASAVGTPSLPPADLRMQTTYAGSKLPRATAPAVPLTPVEPTASVPVQPVSVNGHLVRQEFHRPEPPTRLTPPGARPPVQQGSTPAQTPTAPPTAASPQTPAQTDGPRRWFAPRQQAQSDLLTPPFTDKDEAQEAQGKQSQLFPKATWETPRDPLRVIYSSQLLHAITEHGIVTGESSTVRLKLTEILYDKFGQQTVLLPMDTRILATVDGQVKYGQTRVGLKLEKAELPNGTDLLLTGKGGDAEGKIGLKGRVDNKYGQVVLATLLTTALSVGSRVAVPTSDSYRPKPEEEFAQDISRSLNQTGQDIVKRALSVQPEISVPAHTPVTLQLERNISLQSHPVIIHK